MDLGLTNKVAMVAGASRGLGYAVAHTLAAEGALVSMSSRNSDAISAAATRIQRKTGGTVLAVAADVQSPKEIAHWHQATLDRFEGVDLLYTNSGGPPPGATLSFDDAAWQRAFELLLMSAVRLIRLAVPSMAMRGGGAIVLPTSSSIKEPIACASWMRPPASGSALPLKSSRTRWRPRFPWAATATLRNSPTPRRFCCPMRRPTSPARRCKWMAA